MILFRVGDAQTRSIAKAVSWRVAGSIDTLVISYLVTSEFIWPAP